MQIYVVVEIVYGNEGAPLVRAFKNKADADNLFKSLNEENGSDNQDVLVIFEAVNVE